MKTIKTLAAAAALTLCATGASADIMSATYTGVLNYGVDETGLFGSAGTSMVGEAFEVNFTYDTSLGEIQTFVAGTFLQGGSAFGTDQFMSSVSLTIQNVTLQLAAPLWFGGVELAPDHQLQDPLNHATGSVCHDAQQPANAQPYFYACINTLDAVPSDYDTEFTVLGDPLSNSLAAFLFPNGTTLQGKPDSLVVVRIGESPVEGVPEPATWALLILGFGGAGAMLRSERRRMAVSAS